VIVLLNFRIPQTAGNFCVWFKNSCCMDLVTVALFIVGPYLVDYIESNCLCK
jgi:hypothetical protein